MLSNTGKLAGRTLFITGASRGIGKAIALKAALDGANIVVAAKTVEPHPKLSGTIFTAAKEIESVGGRALPCVVDVRDEGSVQQAVNDAVKQFGGIDIVINNASAISLTGTMETPMKKYDLMHQINTRGTYLVSKLCMPHLLKSPNPHILNISPPLNMNPRWFKNHIAYTMAKYGMSQCVLGMAEEFRDDGIACNALWPRTAIITAAMEMLGGSGVDKQCRKPEIMADAAYVIICKESKSFTGKFAIDDEILKAEGITDFDQYAVDPSSSLMPDFFLDEFDKYAEKAKEFGATSKFHGSKLQEEDSLKTDSQVEKVFTKIEAFLSSELVDKTKAVYSFTLTGNDAGKWYLDLKNGSGACGRGDPPSTADATFAMSSENFFKMFTGSLKPTTAFMSGKIKISGDMSKAMKLETLMGKLKSKL